MTDITGWLLSTPRHYVNIAAQLDEERNCATRLRHESGQPVAFVWQAKPCIVASVLDSQLPHFAASAALSAEAGWPVQIRSTGGTAVAMAPGVVNITLIQQWQGARPSLAQGFELICGVVIESLMHFGVAAVTGSAPRAFCDGRYNVLVAGRKIAGTAQRQIGGAGRGATLLHATALIDADVARLTAAVNSFYAAAGAARTHEAAAAVALTDCEPGLKRADLVREFIVALKRTLAPRGR
jgi:octanoyl-[GcvH]:protein N-octanoyltransferase